MMLPRRLPPLPTTRAERRRALVGLAALAAACGLAPFAPLANAAGDFDLTQLMALLGQIRSGEATFIERRQVAMLDKTLESSGRLSFEAPDTFIRETLKPRQEKIAVVGNRVTMSQGSRSRSVALDSVREASVIIEAIRGTLTGNREALERSFVPTVGGNAQSWSLQLVPREPYLREQVASVRVAGQQGLVREVQVAMFDGDKSVMTIDPAPPAGAAPQPAASGSR